MGDTEILPVRVQNVLDMEIIRLNLWSIKFTATNIKLEGFVRNEEGTMMQKICSEVICKRMNATMLFDVSGRFFELSGQIDREFQVKNGMPSRIVDEFLNGFPENWAFLISNCLTTEQRSVVRPIQAAPVQPLRSREPIVTLADETELGDRTVAGKDTNKERRNKEREEEERKQKLLEEKRQRDRDRDLQREREAAERSRKRAEEEEAERKRQEEDDAANYTFRAPHALGTDAITPIRFHRGKKGPNEIRIFDETPKRLSSGPLASSTLQRPSLTKEQPPVPQEARQKPEEQEPAPRQVEKPPQSFASDADLFAVPRLPAKVSVSSGGFDFLDEMGALFDNAKIEKTPVMASKRKPIPRRYEPETSPPPHLRGQSSSQQAYERDLNSASYYNSRYDDDRSHMSRRDHTHGGYDSGRNERDESRMSRKRGHYSSLDRHDDFDYDRRREDRNRDRSTYEDDYAKRSRARETSSSSGRSVRFEDTYRTNRYDREHRDYDDRDRRDRDRTRAQQERDQYESQKLKEILRREKELEARLRSKKKQSRRVSCSSDEEEPVNMADQWERENQAILDNSMMGERETSRKRKNVPKREPVKPNKAQKPARAPAKKNKKLPPLPDLDDSIASNRPRRACVTPATPAPKRITWPKRDLDKLSHVIDLKKPSASLEDWAEVARLLKKDGVEPADVKQIAETKLKWKEPVQDAQVLLQEEEEEKKRRRGVAAKVKEGVRMREEMREGGEKEDELRSRVESVEDYQPDDMDADQSLLAIKTPVAAKKKGGTRASIMPQPVEDSPVVKGNNTSSFMNSPKLDSTKVKEVETTLKYVQHLSTIQGRPGSSMNKSRNTSLSRGKNTSISVEQGTRKAMKMINRGTTIQEDDEEEEEEDDEEEVSDDDGENVIY